MMVEVLHSMERLLVDGVWGSVVGIVRRRLAGSGEIRFDQIQP